MIVYLFIFEYIDDIHQILRNEIYNKYKEGNIKKRGDENLKNRVFNEFNVCILVIQVIMLYALFVAGMNWHIYHTNVETNYIIENKRDESILLKNDNVILDNRIEQQTKDNDHTDSFPHCFKRIKGVFLNPHSKNQIDKRNMDKIIRCILSFIQNNKEDNHYQKVLKQLHYSYMSENEKINYDNCLTNMWISLLIVFIAFVFNFLIIKQAKRKKQIYLKEYKYIYNKLDILSMNIVMLFILIGTLNYYFLLIWFFPAIILLYVQYLLYKSILYKE